MEYSDPALPRREPRVLWNSTEAPKAPLRGFLILMAWWQNGHAAACKAVYAGSIPTHAFPPQRAFQQVFGQPSFRLSSVAGALVCYQ